MRQLQVVFSHGKESGPWGTKIQAMAEVAQQAGHAVESLDYRGIEDPRERVAKLEQHCKGVRAPLLLVGSSMGGCVAAAAADRVAAIGLFVLAPAFYMPGYEDYTPASPVCPVCIVHGWRDDVVPVDNAIRFAKLCRARTHLIDGDHRLIADIEEIKQYFEIFLNELASEGASQPG